MMLEILLIPELNKRRLLNSALLFQNETGAHTARNTMITLHRLFNRPIIFEFGILSSNVMATNVFL